MRTLVLASLCVALAVAFAAMPGLRYSPNNICPAALTMDDCESINAAKCTWCNDKCMDERLAMFLPKCANDLMSKFTADDASASGSSSGSQPGPVNCTAYATQSTCDAEAACAWCACRAVPSVCVTLAQAKKLPPGVFNCDKV